MEHGSSLFLPCVHVGTSRRKFLHKELSLFLTSFLGLFEAMQQQGGIPEELFENLAFLRTKTRLQIKYCATLDLHAEWCSRSQVMTHRVQQALNAQLLQSEVDT